MSNRGFTLLETAMVMVILGLLTMGVILPFATQKENAAIRSTGSAQDEAQEALLGYAVAQGRLPCPDTTGDGQEDCTGAAVQVGGCPYATLAIKCEDGWGQLLVYAVDGNFTSSFTVHTGVNATSVDPIVAATTPGMTLGTIEVKPNAALDTSIPPYLDLAAAEPYDHRMFAPAVFVSYGKSWARGARSPDETENADNDGVFVSQNHAPDDNAAPYDDRVAWLSWYVLMNRMISAKKLP